MTIAVTAAVEYKINEPPRVKLTATSTTSGPNPVPSNTQLVIVRIHPDGSEHRVITDADPRVIGGGWAGFDYHAKYNDAITYRVTAGAAVATVSTRVRCDFTWLIHPSEPARSVRVTSVKTIGDRTQVSRAGRFEPIEGMASFQSDGSRGGRVGTLIVEVPDESAMRDLLADNTVILLNTPGRGWVLDWLWVQPGDVTYSTPGGVGWPYVDVTLPYEESEDPGDDLTQTWTIASSAAYFLANGITIAQVPDLYTTILDLSTNTRSA